MIIQTNKYQTPIDETLLESLNDEVKEQLLDCINNIDFIKNLISPNRLYAKDLPRDEDNKIIVDLINPHILEDMNYFRPSALHFEEHGCFTFLKPNGNPHSEYGKWINEEKRRCWEGYIRPTDGEWVTGYLYYFLNYSPIMLTKIIENKKGKKYAHRTEAFPECWEGIYWRFHYMQQAREGGLYDNEGGKNCAELASRGKGKSYSLGSILAHNFTLGENEETKHKVNSIVTAYKKEYLTKDGVLNKFISMIDFNAEYTQFPRKRLKNSIQEMTWKMGYKDVELEIDKGTLNTVMGVSSKDDESKLRGKRAAKILIEEFGSFPRLLDMYNVLLPSVREGEYAFGQIYLLGTAGDDDSDFSGAQELIYNPKGYGIYALPNVYDKSNTGKPEFTYFFPGYINRKGCYNKDGVSDVIKALIEILNNRHHVKYNSTDPNTIIKTIAEIPITPAEAIIKYGVNMFPVTMLTERLMQLDSNPREFDDVFIGDIIVEGREAKYKPSSGVPIRQFPMKDNTNTRGSIEIFKLPEKDEHGKVFNNRYILGADPIDDDAANGDKISKLSLASVFVLDTWTDRIVAEYTGRDIMADDYYEKCRSLCIFYNGQLCYENNKKGLFAYFSKYNSIHLLADNLEFLKDKDMAKGYTIGNKSKGINATQKVNTYARERIRNWLLTPTLITNNDGEEVETFNLFTIRNRALLQELINYNSEGNFDRISALGMVMLYRQEKLIMCNGDIKKSINSTKGSSLTKDPFFDKNYRRRR